MEEEQQKLRVLVREVERYAHDLQGALADTSVSTVVREANTGLEQHLRAYFEALRAGDADQMVMHASAVGVYGQALGQRLESLGSAHIEDSRQLLLEASIKLRTLADEGPLAMKPLDTNLSPRLGLDAFIGHDEQRKVQIKQANQTKKLLDESDHRLSEFEKKLTGLEGVANAEILKITEAYATARVDIDEKTAHINRVTGHAAARMIAGDYEGSAAAEKRAADNLRLGALALMLLIVGVLGWAVFETTGDTFHLDKFLSKVSLVFLLGVPAGYLARESAKHREQQYHHLQTSLDMKAISPFLASLPDEEQHKLKAIIASRIFGGRDFSKVSNDPYPINAQELLMKLIDKVEIPSSKSEDAKKRPAEGASAAPAGQVNP